MYYVINDRGKRMAVLLPVKKYKKLLEAMEELEDIIARDTARLKQGEIIPFDQAVMEIERKRKK